MRLASGLVRLLTVTYRRAGANHGSRRLHRVRSRERYVNNIWCIVWRAYCNSGNLALSRAIGDFEFKKNYNVTPDKQVITANPDVKEYQLTDEDEFVVIACDGECLCA